MYDSCTSVRGCNVRSPLTPHTLCAGVCVLGGARFGSAVAFFAAGKATSVIFAGISSLSVTLLMVFGMHFRVVPQEAFHQAWASLRTKTQEVGVVARTVPMHARVHASLS